MDFRKIVLYLALTLVGVALWNAWMKDYAPHPSSTTTTEYAEPQTKDSGNNYVPSTFSPMQDSAEKTVVTPTEEIKTPKERFIELKNDVLNLQIDKEGGNIVSASLPKYPLTLSKDSQPVQILNPDPASLYVTQSGLTNVDSKGQPRTILYKAEKNTYELPAGQDQIDVVLKGKTDNGLEVDKTYTLKRNSYAVDISYKIHNVSNQPWKGSLYYQIVRKNVPAERSFHSRSYDGAAISRPDKPYDKITYKQMDEANLSDQIQGGWVAMQQPYFLSAWVPYQQSAYHYYSHVKNSGEGNNYNNYTIGFVTPEITLEPNKTATHTSILYVGPEVAKQLVKIAKGLDLTVDYGWLWPISKLLFSIMEVIHRIVGNWGWTIILVTLLIKLVFYPLSSKSYRSMVKMRDLQPRMQALKERFGDDKQGMSKAVMELYKKEKVNPMGGCLPMIIQIPVFIALYYVLIESVELRQAPFMFWIQDLTTKDPYYVLPILMGISMFIQQKLSPPPPDPTQAKMMMFLPLVFTVFFLSFPSGLVLYWLTNNLLSILQQWYIMKSYKPATQKKKKR